MSLEGPFPPGPSYNAISRIRGTVNLYVGATSQMFWFSAFKLATVHALSRRFNNHESQMVNQSDVELQFTFEQLNARLGALLGLYKAVKHWSEYQIDHALIHALPHFTILQPVVTYFKLDFAPDLKLYQLVGTFFKTLEDDGLPPALETLSFHTIQRCLKSAQECPEPAPAKAPPATGSGDVDVAEVSPHHARTTAARRHKSKSSASFLTSWTKKDPIEFYTVLVGKALSSCMFNMPDGLDTENQSVLDKWLADVDVARTTWIRATGSTSDSPTAVFLVGLADVCRCCYIDEAKRPNVAEAREGKKLLQLSIKSKDMMIGLAKVALGYPFGKYANSVCDEFCRESMQDLTATSAFEASVDMFEDAMDSAFKDVDSWLATGNNGERHTLQSTATFITCIVSMSGACMLAIKRWTRGGLGKQQEPMMQTLEHMQQGMLLVSSMMANALDNLLFAKVTEVCSVWADALTVAGGVAHIEASQGGAAECVSPGQVTSAVPAQTSPPDARSNDKVLVEFAKLLQVVDNTKTTLLSFNQSAVSTAGSMQRCFVALAGRLGDRLAEQVQTLDFANLLSLMNDNGRAGAVMVDYISEVVSLQQRFVSSDKTAKKSLDSVMMDSSLVGFLKIHYEHLHMNKVQLQIMGQHDDGSVGRLNSAFDKFVTLVGNSVFDEHFSTALNMSLDTIMGQSIPVAVVHQSVIKSCPEAKAQELLFGGPLPTLLVDTAKSLAFVGSAADKDQFENLPHRRQLSHLHAICEATRLATLQVPLAVNTDQPIANMGVDSAMLTLKVQCALLDAALCFLWLSAHLAENTPTMGAKDIDEQLFGTLKWGLSVAMGKIADLEEIAHTQQAVDFEGSGWQLPVSFETVRQWVSLLGIFAGRCSMLLLSLWSTRLEAATQACGKALPSWNACFSGDFDSALAFKMLVGKVAMIVGKHNQVHAVMRDMSAGAAYLKIATPLRNHQLTQEAIACGLNKLKEATVASVVCKGVELLREHQHDVKGVELAKKFLSDHPKPEVVDKEAMLSSIPESFWTELEAMASLAAVGTSPKAAQKSEGSGSQGPAAASGLTPAGGKIKEELGSAAAADDPTSSSRQVAPRLQQGTAPATDGPGFKRCKKQR